MSKFAASARGGGSRWRPARSGGSAGSGSDGTGASSGGWRARMAAKKASAPGGGARGGETGEVLRVSRSGFGFIGASVTARQRYYFHFKDVVVENAASGASGGGGETNGDGTILAVGDRVTYDTRMNDDTMEKEAYNIRRVDGGSQAGISGRGRSQALARKKQGSRNFGDGSDGRKLTAGRGSAGDRRRVVKASGNMQTQKTKDHTDQFGRLRDQEELSGGLLDLVGLDGEEDANVTIAASCDDYDKNPDGGNGFSVEYQRSRGRTVQEKPHVAALVTTLKEKSIDMLQAKDSGKVSAQSKAEGMKFAQRGRGRRLADM